MADKETLIVRQSQMERAIEYYQLMGVKPTSIQLLATADHFSQYVQNGLTKDIIVKSKRLDIMIEEMMNTKKLTNIVENHNDIY